MADALRIVVVEDHHLLLDTLVTALNRVEGFEVIAAVSSVDSFRQVISDGGGDPDVVVTDIDLGDGSGSEVADLARADSSAEVLVMTGKSEEDGVRLALAVGAAGFISKTAPLDDLVAAVRSVAGGNAVFPSSLLRQSLHDATAPASFEALTPREREVLDLLAEGRPAADIALALYISAHTVRNHIRAILAKLEASSQLEAVVKGARYGIVTIR